MHLIDNEVETVHYLRRNAWHNSAFQTVKCTVRSTLEKQQLLNGTKIPSWCTVAPFSVL